VEFYNKVKWVLGIMIVFVLIVATNLIDRNNFLRVKDSVETIYEDRLVANDLIFEMSKSVQEIELAVAKSDSGFFLEKSKQVNNEIQGFVTSFEQTKLTLDEESIFIKFKSNLELLRNSETAFIESNFVQKATLEKQISKVRNNLYALAKIQLIEGQRQMSISKKAIDIVELFTQLEIYLLIFLAIIVQIIVIYNPKD